MAELLGVVAHAIRDAVGNARRRMSESYTAWDLRNDLVQAGVIKEERTRIDLTCADCEWRNYGGEFYSALEAKEAASALQEKGLLIKRDLIYDTDWGANAFRLVVTHKAHVS